MQEDTALSTDVQGLGQEPLTKHQVLYLRELSSDPHRPQGDICTAAGVSRSSLSGWRKHSKGFKQAEYLLQYNPTMASAWLLVYSQPEAVAALRGNLEAKGRTATDAAQVILREARERMGLVSGSSLEDAVDKALARREAQQGTPPE